MRAPQRQVFAAAALYLLWTAATWFFEGRIRTLLRPDAVAERLTYVIVVNIALGTAGALWLLRARRRSAPAATPRDGFAALKRSLIAGIIAIALGLGFFRAQGVLSSTNTLAIANGYAQTLPVSIAEILVCWSVFGRAIEDWIATPRWLALGAAAVAASLAFGLYHIGHSPPFNTAATISFLTVVGLATSVFFFMARDVYGTILFHNFAAAFGVVQATGGRAELQPPLYVLALLAVVVLIALDRAGLRRPL